MKSWSLLIPVVTFIMLAACSGNKQNGASESGIASHIAPEKGEKQVEGYVFHDQNRNQEKDEGESGIAGVAVSNGTDVVVTDQQGHYGLPVGDDNPVFVIKPGNWMTPVNSLNLPRFYYLHKPGGSPKNFKYRGVSPTGPLPERVNFPLHRHDESPQFRFAVLGDPQPYSSREVDYFAEDIVSELIASDNLSFGITMGDIVGDTLPLFREVNQAVAQVGIPWYHVMGNHDINYQAASDKMSDETFERVYGPATYAFVYGRAHFIILDDIIHEAKSGSREYVGGLRDDQLKFVKNYLQTVPKDHLIVLNMHIPLAREGDRFRQEDQQRLFDLLGDYPHTLSISAHTHVQDNLFFHRDSSRWRQAKPHHHYNVGTTSGSWWTGIKGETNIPHTMMRDGTPNGYAVLTIRNNDYTIDWKVAGSGSSHRMNIYVPRDLAEGSTADKNFTVNFFNGTQQSRVRYRINKTGQWQSMQKVNRVDPFYAKLNRRWNNFRKLGLRERWKQATEQTGFPLPGEDLPQPQASTHLWTGELPGNLPSGSHTLEVEVSDRYGRTFTGKKVIRIDAQ